jgi:hypothetical protein
MGFINGSIYLKQFQSRTSYKAIPNIEWPTTAMHLSLSK